MATRTFKADTMINAFQEIQRELGPEAIVVSVRKVPSGSPWQVWRQPYVEVVAMTTPAAKNSNEMSGVNQEAKKTASAEKSDGILIRRVNPKTEIPAAPAKQERIPAWTDVKTQPPAGGYKPSPASMIIPGTQPHQQKNKTFKAAMPWSDKMTSMDLPGVIGEIRQKLASQGVSDKTINKVTRTCLETFGPLGLQDGERVQLHIRRQLEAGLRVQAPTTTLANNVMCLVGASGSGKTSSCAKLATFYAKTLGKQVAWICADTVRAGAIGEARMYTDALGINLHLAYTPEDIKDALEAEANTDMVLVDTPGCNPRNETKVVELGAFLSTINKRATYIVAPATMKEADIFDILAAFGPFNLKGLIFTKLDETRAFGNLYNVASQSQLPLTFFSTGTRIMDDLHPGEDTVLVDALFGEGFAR